MKDLVLIGAGGFGREVAWIVSNINKVQREWNLLGFIDDNPDLKGKIINDIPVLGGTEWFSTFNKKVFATCAIGNPKIRETVINTVSEYNNVFFATLIDPSVMLSNYVRIREGSIVCAGSILTVNIAIGKHVIVNFDCTIGHDAIINDYSTLYPSVNISGATNIGRYVEMGTGSQIIQGLTIGEGTIVGAGAVVVKVLPAHCTAVGQPAKPIKFHR